MSGIFGIFSLDRRPVSGIDLQRMVKTLIHRGPDGEGIWQNNPVGLGSLLHAITPESVYEDSPFECRESGLVIVSDAILHNREDLCEKLSVSSKDAQKIPDSQLILNSYKKWEKGCLSHLMGEFAFAIWDKKRENLFCARDHLGFRPLFYYHSDHYFVFASEVKSIRSLPFIQTEFNETALAQEMFLIKRDHASTYFKNIFRLKAARFLEVSREKINIKSYWMPHPGKHIQYDSARDYTEELRELIVRAVHCRIRTRPGIPVGITLSGGLDSSAVACIAAQKLKERGERLTAFSSVLPEHHQGIETDERTYIREVGRQHPNIDIKYITAPGCGPLDFKDMEKGFHEIDSPVKAVHYLGRYIRRTAKKNGVQVMLSGAGGDHMVSCLPWDIASQLVMEGQWGHALETLRQLKKNENKSWRKILKKYLFMPLLPEPFLNAARLILRGKVSHGTAAGSFVETYQGKTIFRPAKAKNQRQRIADLIKAGKFGFETQGIAESYYGIQLCTPLFDKRIVEFFMDLPPLAFMAGGHNRGLFRLAMHDILPEKVQWRPDKGVFAPDFHRRVLAGKEDAVRFLNTIKPEDDIRQYIDVDKIRRQFEYVRPVCGRMDWDLQTQGIIGRGIAYILFLNWVKQLEYGR